MATVEKLSAVAAANDLFRRGGFGVVVTGGVNSLEDIGGLLRIVREFDAFTPGNDPYGEHDFGSILWGDAVVFWKIDYYDRQLRYGVNPQSPYCRRIITVMLSNEY